MTDDDQITQMRGYMELSESYAHNVSPWLTMEADIESTNNEPAQEDDKSRILSDLTALAFKLRSYLEAEEGDFGLGVEMGMQRAADMLDNVVRRYTDKEDDDNGSQI